MVNSYGPLNGTFQLSVPEVIAVETVRQHLSTVSKKKIDLIACRAGEGRKGIVGGPIVVAVSPRDGYLKLKSKSGRFTSNGVSPFTLVDYIKNCVPILG